VAIARWSSGLRFTSRKPLTPGGRAEWRGRLPDHGPIFGIYPFSVTEMRLLGALGVSDPIEKISALTVLDQLSAGAGTKHARFFWPGPSAIFGFE